MTTNDARELAELDELLAAVDRLLTYARVTLDSGVGGIMELDRDDPLRELWVQMTDLILPLSDLRRRAVEERSAPTDGGPWGGLSCEGR